MTFFNLLTNLKQLASQQHDSTIQKQILNAAFKMHELGDDIRSYSKRSKTDKETIEDILTELKAENEDNPAILTAHQLISDFTKPIVENCNHHITKKVIDTKMQKLLIKKELLGGELVFLLNQGHDIRIAGSGGHCHGYSRFIATEIIHHEQDFIEKQLPTYAKIDRRVLNAQTVDYYSMAPNLIVNKKIIALQKSQHQSYNKLRKIPLLKNTTALWLTKFHAFYQPLKNLEQIAQNVLKALPVNQECSIGLTTLKKLKTGHDVTFIRTPNYYYFCDSNCGLFRFKDIDAISKFFEIYIKHLNYDKRYNHYDAEIAYPRTVKNFWFCLLSNTVLFIGVYFRTWGMLISSPPVMAYQKLLKPLGQKLIQKIKRTVAQKPKPQSITPAIKNAPYPPKPTDPKPVQNDKTSETHSAPHASPQP